MDHGFAHASWEATFAARPFGKYPSEEAVRFFFATRSAVGSAPSALDIGCGAGAVAWFLARNGVRVTAMDGAPSALVQLEATLRDFGCPPVVSLLGDITQPRRHVAGPFDLLVDHYSLYANHQVKLREALEAYRELLAPGGRFLCCLFGTGCTGAEAALRLDANTFTDFPAGVHRNTGIITLWTQEEAENLLRACGFQVLYRERQLHDRNGVLTEKLIFHLAHP